MTCPRLQSHEAEELGLKQRAASGGFESLMSYVPSLQKRAQGFQGPLLCARANPSPQCSHCIAFKSNSSWVRGTTFESHIQQVLCLCGPQFSHL